MAALVNWMRKLYFRSLVTSTNTLVSFTFHRRLSFQRNTCGLIYSQSLRTIVRLSSTRTRNYEQDLSKPEHRHQHVLLIDETGTNLGEKSLSKALDMAREKSVELVWTNKRNKTAIPVYKMVRKIDLQQTGVKPSKTKNVEMTDRIEPRDLNVKLNQIQKWLEKGHQVRVCVKSKSKSGEDKWKIMSEIIKKVEQDFEETGVSILRSEDTPRQVTYTFKPPMETTTA